jgi:hypothetical protein
LLVALVLALFVLGVILWPGGRLGERRALERMAPSERGALYEETKRNVDAICERAKTELALSDRCNYAAEFLLAFPECDDQCRAFAHARRHTPTR